MLTNFALIVFLALVSCAVFGQHIKIDESYVAPFKLQSAPELTKNICFCNQTQLTNRELKRDPYKWSKIYLKENLDGRFKLIADDETMDKRVANLIRSQEVYRLFDINGNTLDSDDVQVHEEYRRYINGPEVNAETCSKQLRQMVELLDELEVINENKRMRRDTRNATLNKRHIYLARILDSYGRYEGGALSGRSKMLGSSKQCLETPLLLGTGASEQEVRTRVCSVKLSVDTYLDDDLRSLTAPELSKHQASFELAACLPNSCHSDSLKFNKDLIQRLVDSQFALPSTIYVHKHRKIEDLFCLNDGNEPIDLPTTGRVLLWLAAVWMIALCYVTYRSDILMLSDNKFVRLAGKHMDLKEIMTQFAGSNATRARNRVDFDTLNVIRFLAMSMIILAHAYLIYLSKVPDAIRMSSKVHMNWFFSWMHSTSVQVDTFFVISGMIFTVILMKKFDAIRDVSSPWKLANACLKISFFRYLRLVPLYFLLFWFKKSVWIYTGSGLVSDKGYNQHSLHGSCKQETWLTPFTPLASYLPLRAQCIPQAWSVGCDIFSAIFITPLILAISRRPKVFVPLAALVAYLSILHMYNSVYSLEPHLFDILEGFKGDITFVSSKRSDLYTNIQFRIGSMLIGVLSGYVLYCYQEGAIKDWPAWFKSYATRLALVAAVFVKLYLATLPLQYAYVFPYIAIRHRLYPHIFVASRFIWAAACAILFLRVTTDWRHSFLVRLTNGNAFRVLSKLNYTVLLLHLDILHWIFDDTQRQNEYSHLSTTAMAATLVYSLVLGFFIHICFESPISGMLKGAFEGHTENRIKAKLRDS